MPLKTNEQFLQDLKDRNILIEPLEEYKGYRTKIRIKCKKCGHEWSKEPTQILAGQGCPQCFNERRWTIRRKSTDSFKQELIQHNPDIELLSDYTGENNNVTLKCKKCGRIWSMNAGSFVLSYSCSVCSNKKVQTGINDVATTHPHLIKYFVNPLDATKYTYGSGKKVKMKCPICKKNKTYSISELSQNGFLPCNYCGDGISYPNKYVRGFLSQLSIQSLIPEWHLPNDTTYFFDNYFEYNGQQYVVEVDGGQHFKNIYHWGTEYETIYNRDLIKKQLLNDHNIILIRIDAKKSTGNYLKEQIMNSLLSQMFNLSEIDWDYCNQIATSSLIVEVCNDYVQNPGISLKELSNKWKLHTKTISRYLTRGTELGICNYESVHKSHIPITVRNIATDEKYFFNSIREAVRTLNDFSDIRFDRNEIKNHLDNNIPYKGYLFFYEKQIEKTEG